MCAHHLESDEDDLDDPMLTRWLSLTRTEDERQRTITQWRERRQRERAERDAQLQAELKPKRERDEQAFKHIVREKYPFSDESFDADWPVLRARLAARLIEEGVAEGWAAYQEQQERRRGGTDPQ